LSAARGLLLALALLVPAAAGAQTLEDYDYEDLHLGAVGPEVGWVLPADLEPAPSFGIRADLGYVGPHVRIAPAIRFWSSSLRQEEVQRLAQQIVRICERQATAVCPSSLDLGQLRRSDLELSADAHYVLREGNVFTPFAGGGVSLHLLNGRGEFIDDTFVEDLLDTVAPGVSLLGGLSLPLGSRLQLLTEGRLVLSGDVRYASVALGGTWNLPGPPRAPAP
jgi:hypothetical protein